MNAVFLDQELRRFLLEDLGHAEVDTRPADGVKAVVLAEERGVMCGGRFMTRMFNLLAQFPEQVAFPIVERDGFRFGRGDTLASFRIHPEILRHGIRVGLNLMQTLSGIAANTAKLVQEVQGTGCTLLDTRKTTPGFRAFEKYAVQVGGGRNHRFNRLDGVILKKEDIVLDGGIAKAAAKAADAAPFLNAIEVEVETLAQLEEALALPQVSHILLDNMEVETVRQAVIIADGRKILETSGVTAETLRAYAETGVPFISTSALIRDARPLKMKMRILPA